MRSNTKHLVLTVIMFAVLLSLVIGIAALLLQPKPKGSELLSLAGFLLISGGITLSLCMFVSRSGLPSWVHSIRTQLLLISTVVAVLVVVNIGFVAYLMFISTNDLGLLVGLIVFSLGLSIMAALYLSQPTARNINAVISAVRQINAGNLQANVPLTSGDEVRELAIAFNAMVQRLQESLSRERNLEHTRRDLIEAVSHDLRTPLTSIRAMIESINDGVVTDDATVKRYLLRVQSEIENLGQLVNDLFESSHIDAGLLELHTDSVFLQQLISDTVETMTAQAALRQLTLKGKIDKELPPVVIDPTRIQRVLSNLIQNAIRHTPANGSINISATDIGDVIQVQVTDTGEGIPAEDLTKVFERGYRSERSGSRQSGGTALGLSIAKGIIEAHGGRIWVYSEPDHGSVFSFTIPKATATRD